VRREQGEYLCVILSGPEWNEGARRISKL